jgi:ABC-type nitrate/sulfonate/bicarbonate transport system substrate-binding protein
MQLTYGLVSPTATYWAHYVARERGLYAVEGLDVAETLTGSTLGGAEAVAAGRIDLSGSCPDQVVLAVERGVDLAVVGGVVRRPVSAVLVRPEIADFAALRGKRVGMSDGVGGVSSLLRAILRRHGLKASDYETVVVGGTPEQGRALEAGEIACAMLTHPFSTRLAARGMRVLAHTDDYFAAYPFTTLNARRAWATGQADSLVAFLRATIRAGRWLRDPANADAARAILAAATGLSAAEVADTYARYVGTGDVLAWEAEPDAPALQAVLDLLRAEGLLTRAAPPERYVDARAWERVRASPGT